MAIGDIVSLRVVGRYQSQNIVNTFHYRISLQGANEKEVLEQLVDTWDDDVQPAWSSNHIDSYNLVGLKAFNHTGVAKVPAFRVINVAGSVVGDKVPSPVCRTITLYTESPNYRRRGRAMLSGCEAGMFMEADGSVTNAQIIILQTLGDLLYAPLEGAADTFQLCLPSGDAGPLQDIIAALPRVTPSLISSRRVNQFLVG